MILPCFSVAFVEELQKGSVKFSKLSKIVIMPSSLKTLNYLDLGKLNRFCAS